MVKRPIPTDFAILRHAITIIEPVAKIHGMARHVPAVHGASDGGSHRRSLTARVADEALDGRKQPARLAQQRLGAFAVLHIGRMRGNREQHADGVDQASQGA
jgi:hypothetical protein